MFRGHPILVHAKCYSHFRVSVSAASHWSGRMLHHTSCLTLCWAVVWHGRVSSCHLNYRAVLFWISLMFFFVDVTVQVLHVHQSQHFTKECPQPNWSERFESRRPDFSPGLWSGDFLSAAMVRQKPFVASFPWRCRKPQLSRWSNCWPELSETSWDVYRIFEVVAQIKNASIGGPVEIARASSRRYGNGRQGWMDGKAALHYHPPALTQIKCEVSDALQPPLPKAINAHDCSGSIEVGMFCWMIEVWRVCKNGTREF